MESGTYKSPFVILKATYNTVLVHPEILFPFCIMAFIQLFVLEVLFFGLREPLVNLFAPLIQLEGGRFLHYPYNFLLLTKWFNQAQVPLYVFFNSFFIGTMVLIIHHINEDRPIHLRQIFKETFSVYLHLFLATALSVFLVVKLSEMYQIFIRGFLLTSGASLMFKKIIFHGDGFVYLYISVCITTLLGFVIPIIVIEKKGVLTAIRLNFRNQLKSFWHIFILVSLPAILYIPVFLLKISWHNPNDLAAPELLGALLAGGVFLLLFIDAIQYTAITTYYLFQQGK